MRLCLWGALGGWICSEVGWKRVCSPLQHFLVTLGRPRVEAWLEGFSQDRAG